MSSLSPQVPKPATSIDRASLEDKHDPNISIPAQASILASTTLIVRPQSIDHSPGDGDESCQSIAVFSEVPRFTPALLLSRDRDALSQSKEDSRTLVSPATADHSPGDGDEGTPGIAVLSNAPCTTPALLLSKESEDNEISVSIAPATVDHLISLTSNMSSMSVSPHTLADKEAATYMKPPSPPPDTVKGYNKQMDEPRPATIQDYLRSFEVLFVVDDSGSMAGNRWKEMRNALGDIAEYAFEFNVHTVSLRFLNNVTYVRGLQANVLSLFDKVRPDGWTPTGAVLNTVFGQHLGRIDAAVRKGGSEYSKILPLDIIVLTDGMPSDRPADVVAQAVRRLRSSHYHPNTMGVQFVQIADEELAKNALKELVMGDNARIVDTVPYRGIVTSQKLQRILLGGLHPNIRKMLPVDMLAI